MDRIILWLKLNCNRAILYRALFLSRKYKQAIFVAFVSLPTGSGICTGNQQNKKHTCLNPETLNPQPQPHERRSRESRTTTEEYSVTTEYVESSSTCECEARISMSSGI
jgi:hypothetical protein